jgi:hypothetical protein
MREKKEHLYAVGGNGNEYSLYGNQYGYSSEKLLGIIQKNVSQHTILETFLSLFIETLFILAKL